MGIKYLWFTAIAAIVAFGLSVSGCNKNGNRTAMRSTSSRSGQPAKPAEVLSASAYRPPTRASAPLPPPAMPTSDVYTMAPPAPQYYVQAHPTPELAMAQSRISAPVVYSQPVVYTQPAAPVQTSVSTQPLDSSAPVFLARAPIPELEPARAYRLPTKRSGNRPVAEVMISERPLPGGDRQEVTRALAPIAQAPAIGPGQGGWVASPITAMTTVRAY